MTLRVVSYGGGVQSTALLVLAAERRIDFPIFLFSNVGDDSEHPATLRYVREVAMPYAAAHGIELHELQKVRRDGRSVTLLGSIYEKDHSITIPARIHNGAPMQRQCTRDFKISVISKWIKQHGATVDQPATVGLGISIDELQRARSGHDPRNPEQHRVYPLLDLRLNRGDCMGIIAAAGLPVPGKSSCFFCPFHRITEWQRLRRDEPDLFVKSQALETMLHERAERIGMRQPIYLTAKGMPLDQAIGDQSVFDFEDTCESGYCMT